MSAYTYDPGDDLVDDRAIEKADDDHFGHAEFASQAAQTICAMRAPANIAVYAPWGSGKTSLAHLLQKDLASETCGFAYFDAFKYAEAPLRREFIRRISNALGVSDEKFDRGLYEEETTNGFTLKKTTIEFLVRVIGWVVVVAVLFTFALSLLLAQASGKELWPEWADTVRRLLPSIFAPSVVVGPILALIKGQLDVSRKRYAPQSDEEFERLFREVIDLARKKNKRWQRVVIFIDELDRCAADEVASTLETLRTFLEVEGCVFVVAADRSVLETAVALQGRQETPLNTMNPYYSVGSSYLDKIFQYQWQLPPMMPSSLTRFAQALVKDRKAGIWAEVDSGEAVSVLVPLHVQSPRRVKELLNAFAMSYRIAERRIADGHLEGDLRSRAAELAKLVCLQLEFPLFASDLPNEPRLPQLVLDLSRDPEAARPTDVAPEVWTRARAYAEGRADLDVMIASPTSTPALSAGGVDDATEAQATASAHVATAQGHLLTRYLQKTARIPGPEADLTFMEGAGSAFGLPTAVAVRLKSAATERRVSDVVSSIAPLQPDRQLAALQLLAMHVRESLLGIEGDNALSTLLGAIGALPDLDLSPIVDELADAVNSGIGAGSLPPEDIPGAVVLGLATRRNVGSELVMRALADEALESDATMAAFIIDRANDFDSRQVERLGELVAALIVDRQWDDGPETILEWSESRAEAILAATQSPMLNRIARAKAAADATPEVAAQQATAVAVAEPAVGEPEDRTDVVLAYLAADLYAAAREAGDGHTALREALLELILALDTSRARETVLAELPALAPLRSSSLTSEVVAAAERRTAIDGPQWLDVVDPEVLSKLSDPRGRLERVVVAGWKMDPAKPGYLAAVESLAPSAARLASAIGWAAPATLNHAIAEAAGQPAVDEPHIAAWTLHIRAARELEQHQLLNSADWRQPFVAAAVQLAMVTPPDDATRVASRDALIEHVIPLVTGMPGELVDQLVDAMQAAQWLVVAERSLAVCRLAVFGQDGAGERDLPSSATSAIHAAFNEAGDADVTARAVAEWLSGCSPAISDAWQILNHYPDLAFPPSVTTAIGEYSSRLSPSDRALFVRGALSGFPDTAPSEALLDTARWHESNLKDATDIVEEMYGTATNEDHRRNVMRLWSALRLTDPDHVRKLVARVMKPLIAQGKTSRDIVLQNLNLVSGLPNRDKREIAQLFEEYVDADQWESVSKKLAQAQLMYEHRSGWRQQVRVDHLRD